MGRLTEASTPGATVTGPTPLAFWWRLSGGLALDSLSFEVDGVAQGPGLTGTTDWQRWEGSLGAGNHQLCWRLVREAGSTAVAYLDEVLIGAPVPATIASHPASEAVPLGGSAAFNVTGAGTPPLDYQWLKDGAPLGSATGSGLLISPVAAGDAGGYSAIVTNPYGCATSEVATLTVLNLGILIQPNSQTHKEGESVTFYVTAGGVPPFGYQWRKQGQPRAGATAPSLTLNNLQRTDAGAYDVVVTNLYGSVTSAVAELTLNAAVPDSFHPVISGPVFSFLPELGGTLILGGAFYRFYANPTGNALARLDSEGNTLWDFHPRIAVGEAQAVALLPDGTLLAGGQFSAYFEEQGQPILSSFMRFSATGVLLPTFYTNYSGPVYAIAPQADGKVLIGGNFTALDGIPRTMLARYLPTGEIDSTFAPVANALVFALAVLPDGNILAGGMFTSLGGQPRNRIGRLTPRHPGHQLQS